MEPKNESMPAKKKRGWLFWTMMVVGVLLIVIAGVGWSVYSTVNRVTQKAYKPVEVEQVRTEEVTPQKQRPLSFLLLGVDTGDYGRTEQGRSDAMLVMTVNPEQKHTSLLSIPRDTRGEIVGMNIQDKVNHAYAYGGVSTSINTVQRLLDIPIDYYVEINMAGLRDILTTIGEIEVVPNATFELNGDSFTQGQKTTLTADSVLNFVRERYVDSDFGRQERQRMVIVAIAKKMASLDSIANYSTILETLSDNIQTNLTFADLQQLFLHYRSSFDTIDQLQLSGEGTMIDNIYYNIPDADLLQEITGKLRTDLELPAS